jgi:hypothetical protein
VKKLPNDTKYTLTKKLVELITQGPVNEQAVDKAYRLWWKNLRKNGDRSFGLTQAGYRILSEKGNLKFYEIDLPDNIIWNSQLVIWLDRYIDCPYYICPYSDWIDRYTIFVSREKVAVQLILFGGDLYKFGKAKAESAKNC